MKGGMGSSGYEDNENVPFGMCPDNSEPCSLKPTTSDTSNLNFNVLGSKDIEEEMDYCLRQYY